MASLQLLAALVCLISVNGQMMNSQMGMPMPDANGVYNVMACEGMNMMLECPEATQIRIMDGFFGRNDNATCVVSGRVSTNINCIADKARVVDKLKEGCEGKMSCSVPATIETFTSPCSTDVSKFARASYYCTPTYHKVEVCQVQEGSKVQLCCPDNRLIMMQNAFYGRMDTHSVCRSQYSAASNKTNCSGVNTLGMIQEMCDGSQSCELDLSMLGMPCGGNGNYKYLSLNYTCQECRNDLGDDALCEVWANEGQCYENPTFMYASCRKACLRCGEEMPPADSTTSECYNRGDDVQCELWASQGECNNNPTYMLPYCRKTCMACGLKTDCIDRNKNCTAWADQGECTSNPGFMLPMCRRSCFQCDTIVGCRDNPTYAAQCPTWAEQGECNTNAGFMLPFCTKTCLKCTTSPMCTNKHKNEEDCLYWANTVGQCASNPTWMYQNCWADCIGCLREPVCTNYWGNDAECDWWWYTGEAKRDPIFMMYNCLKSVTRCRPKNYVEQTRCRNKINNETLCTQYAARGECANNAIWMMRNCYKTCTKCDATPVSSRVGGCMRIGSAYSAEYATNVILPYQFTTSGALKQFSGFFINTERVRIGVWRKSGSSWVEIYGQDYTPKGMNTLEVIPVTSCVNVMAGDRIGFTKTTYGDYPFAYGVNKMGSSENKVYVRPTTSGNFVGIPVKGTFAVDAIIGRTTC